MCLTSVLVCDSMLYMYIICVLLILVMCVYMRYIAVPD